MAARLHPDAAIVRVYRTPFALILTAALLASAALLDASDLTGVDRHRLQRELEEYRQLARQNRNNPLPWVKLGVTLQEMDHHMPDGGSRAKEAISAYKKALDLGLPDDMAVSIYGNMGAMQMSNGFIEESITSLNAGQGIVLKAGLDSSMAAGLLYNRGKAYSYLGQTAKSRASFEEAMSAAAEKDPHIYALAFASLKEVGDKVLLDMENAARYLDGLPLIGGSSKRSADMAWLDSISQQDRGYLYFGLYQANNARGKLEQAWEHLHRGNKLYRQALGDYSLQGDAHLMQTLLSVFRGKFGGGGYQDATPIFVVGVPRSGSSLIEQILASHSKVYGAGEDTAMAPIIGEMISNMHGTPTSAQVSMLTSYGQKYVQEMRNRLPQGVKASRIVDKMLRNLWNIGHIHMMLPQSCIIHAVRHPVDTALSCYEQPFEGRGTPWAWNMEEIGDYVMMNHAIARHWNNVLPGRVMTVMYEDLVSNQEDVTRQMLSHCNLDFEPAVLQFHKANRGVRTASLAQVRKEMYNSSVLKHKRVEHYIQPLVQKLASLSAHYEAELQQMLSARSMAILKGGSGVGAKIEL